MLTKLKLVNVLCSAAVAVRKHFVEPINTFIINSSTPPGIFKVYSTECRISILDHMTWHSTCNKTIVITHRMTWGVGVFFICYLVIPGETSGQMEKLTVMNLLTWERKKEDSPGWFDLLFNQNVQTGLKKAPDASWGQPRSPTWIYC